MWSAGSGGASGYGIAFPLKLAAGQTYFLSGTGDGTVGATYYDENGELISYQNNRLNKTITVPENTTTTLIGFYANTSNTDFTFSDIQLELGSSATTYEPYNPNKTVYGGWVDLITGEVWKTYHHMIIDKNSRVGIFPWMGTRTDDTTGLEYTGVLWMREKNDPKAKGYNNLICYCDSYPYHTLGSQTRIMNSAGMYDGDSYGPSLFLPISEVGTTSESLTAFMEDKTFNFVYLMKEPQLVGTLTQTALKTLRGTNNIWSNANGDIQVKYWTH